VVHLSDSWTFCLGDTHDWGSKFFLFLVDMLVGRPRIYSILIKHGISAKILNLNEASQTCPHTCYSVLLPLGCMR